MSADKKYVSKENLAAFAEALAAQVPLKSDIPTKVSDLQNDLGFTDKPGTITSVTLNGTTTSSGGVDLGYLVVQEGGKGLSSNDYTSLEKSKLAGIESGAEVNTIESISVNGTTVQPSEREVSITIPTNVSDLTNDAGYLTSFTEADPVFGASPAAGITASDITNWNGKQDALTFDSTPTQNSTNPVTSGGLYTVITQNEYVTAEAINDLEDRVSDIEDSVEDITVPTKVSDLQNDSGFTSNTGTITGITMNGASKGTSGVVDLGTIVVSESDPVFSASAASGITASDISNWNSKTSNTGTLTGVSFNGTAATVSNGVASISTTIPDVDNYFDEVAYDSQNKRINFKHGNTIKKYIDATDFIKDGMVDDVEIATPETGTNAGVSCLVVTFNTDAGKEDIEIPLSSIFNPTNYYTKTEADGEFVAQESGKGLSSEDYTSAEKTKLSGIETGAQVNVKPDWNAASGSSAEILNKPTIPSAPGTLITNNATAQTTSAGEALSGTINLHKVAKTGSYSDLLNTPTIPIEYFHFGSTYASLISDETINSLPSGTYTSVKAALTANKYPVLVFDNYDAQDALLYSTYYFIPIREEQDSWMDGGITFTLPQGDSYSQLVLYSDDSVMFETGTMSQVNADWSASSGVAEILNKPTIPTESTVSAWGFTKNSGTYSKPSGGIPATDLESAVQTSLGKADTALQSFTETDPVFSASAAAGITSSDITNWNSKTSNTGTLTGVKVNGSNVTVTGGIADVGTVITSHQDIKTINNQTITGTGNVTLNTLPSVSSSDNGKILQVVNGAWTLVTPASLYSGTETPSNSLGNDGDIYLQT